MSRKAGEIAILAAKQYGHVTRQQLLGLGLSNSAIGRMVAARRLRPVHSGVYALGYLRRDPLSRAMAAVLACGRGAMLSHEPAAVLWGFRSRWPSVPEVTVQSRRRRDGIRIHNTHTLESRDIRTHKGIRVTSPARTLRDLKGTLSEREHTRAVNDARLMKLIGREEGKNPTRSVFEDEFLAFARRFGLPTPIVNTTVNGREVDALFPDQKVIVELDGYDFHSGRRAFVNDPTK